MALANSTMRVQSSLLAGNSNSVAFAPRPAARTFNRVAVRMGKEDEPKETSSGNDSYSVCCTVDQAVPNVL